MALAPWDLVSWQSQSETGSQSDLFNYNFTSNNNSNHSQVHRRDSYLRATHCQSSLITPHNMSIGGLDRNESFKLSRNYSVTTTPLKNFCNKLSPAAKSCNASGRPEVFNTPTGEVSLVVTDHSASNNNSNKLCPIINGGTNMTKPLDTTATPKSAKKILEEQRRKSSAEKGGRPSIFDTPEHRRSSEPPLARGFRLPSRSSRSRGGGRPPYLSRDIFVLCLVFIFAFSAVRAVQVLQSSVNDKGKLGTMSLSVFYLTLAITVILIPPMCHDRLSDRSLLCLGIFFLLLWLVANIVPYPLILLPAAMFGGAGLTMAWTAQMNAFKLYFHTNEDGTLERKLSLRRILLTNNTLFALFQSSHVWGNLSVAAILLKETWSDDPTAPNNYAVTVKVIASTNRSNAYNLTLGPGWYFLPPFFQMDIMFNLANQYEDLWFKCKKNVDFFPPINSWANLLAFDQIRLAPMPAFWALAWLAILGFIALLIAVIFFHPHQPPKRASTAGHYGETKDQTKYKTSRRIQKFVVSHLFQLFDGPHFRLLIPLLFFNGLEQGFLYTDYTKIFLTCMFGLSSVGVAIMVAGVMSCIFSAAASFAAKRSVSREIIISITAIVHLALAAFLYQWQAYPSIPIVVIIIPIIYGFCDAVWQTHCYVLITKVAGDDHQLAFSNFRILQSLGIATSCILSFVAGLTLKIIILVINLLLSVLCYAILENRIRREELALKDRERLVGAFRQLTMVMGAPGIKGTPRSSIVALPLAMITSNSSPRRQSSPAAAPISPKNTVDSIGAETTITPGNDSSNIEQASPQPTETITVTSKIISTPNLPVNEMEDVL